MRDKLSRDVKILERFLSSVHSGIVPLICFNWMPWFGQKYISREDGTSCDEK